MPKMLTHAAALLTVLILTGVIYGQTLDYSFHFDDYYFITENLKIRDITNVPAIWQSLAKPSRFLGMFSFALNYQLHGTDVRGYHIVNILIHGFNGCLVYWFCWLTTGLASRPVKHRLLAALFAAALFTAHPVNTQAVTYIAQRFASLATLFYLFSLCLYIQARLAPRTGGRMVLFGLALISCLAGMLTKQIVLTLPVTVLLYEYCFFRQGRWFRVTWWQAALLGGLFLLIPTLQGWDFRRIFDVAIASRSHEGDLLTWRTYSLTQFRVIPVYLRLLIFPVGQTLDYDFRASTSFWQGGTWAGALLIGVLFGGGARRLKSEPLIGFGICWFFLTMALESTIIPIYQVIFEHRCYLPSVGFALATATITDRLFMDRRKQVLAIFIVIAVLSWSAFQRNQVWENEITLWQDIKLKAPLKVRPYIHLGVARLMRGEYDQALKVLDEGIAIRQDNYRLYHNRGLVYEMQGKLKEALWNYSKAIELNSSSAVSLTNRAGLFLQIQRYDLALDDYNNALRANPAYGNAYLGRGNLYYRARRYRPALDDFVKAVELGVPIEQKDMDAVRRLAR